MRDRSSEGERIIAIIMAKECERSLRDEREREREPVTARARALQTGLDCDNRSR
jgi:hypothetical protein